MTCLAFAPVPDKGKGDLERMQGTWLLTEEALAGRSSSASGAWRVRVVGSRLTYLVGDKPTAKYALTLDGSAKPKRFTFKGVGDAGSCRGVYRLDTRSLTICY